MTRLIHLNGPPGIGKSTISALYADRHPGTLNLDIDSLQRLVGGWEADTNYQTHEVLRPVALAMAAAHLDGGRDVVLPQYMANRDLINAFESVALEHKADFLEFILLDTKEESIARFDRRPDRTPWDRHSRRFVALHGGSTRLGTMYDELQESSRAHPSGVVIRSEAGAVEETYALLMKALSGTPASAEGQVRN